MLLTTTTTTVLSIYYKYVLPRECCLNVETQVYILDDRLLLESTDYLMNEVPRVKLTILK